MNLSLEPYEKSKIMKIIEVYEKILAKNPEYRKEIGAFYTPKFIVDYMVSITFKKSFENKTYQEISQIQVLDTACGGGAFLVGAYNYLLEYHTKSKQKELSIKERISILKTNIFGVDIDSEAIKVCKKALLMTCYKTDSLENIDETELLENIKCSDFLLDESGSFTGFDIVIGNPPYIMEYGKKSVFEGLREKIGYQGKTDIWHIFTCESINLLKKKGFLCFIAKNHWMESSAAEKMRAFIYKNTKIHLITDFGANMVFDKASVQTMVFLLQRDNSKDNHLIEYTKIENSFPLETIYKIISKKIELEELKGVKSLSKIIPVDYDPKANLTFANILEEDLLKKIESKKNFEFNDKEIIQGIIGGPDEAFMVKKEDLKNFTAKEKVYLKMFHTHTDKYYTLDSDKYILYLSKHNFNPENIEKYPNIKKHFEPFEPYKDDLIKKKVQYGTPNKPYFYLHRERDEKFFVGVDSAELIEYPNIAKKLEPYKEQLENRREVLTKSIKYYHLWWARNEDSFKEGEKLVWAKRTEGARFAITNKSFYGSANLFFIQSERINLKYLTAVLNSKLFYFYMHNKLKHTGDLLQIDKNQFMKIPLFKATNNKQETKIIELVDLVDKILFLKEEKKDTIKLEEKIDKLVYELYGLTDEEINVIKESIK